MMTLKASAVLILAYVLALAAGTTSGLLADRLRAPAGGSAPLADQLQLNPTQRDQFLAVWENVSEQMDQCYAQAQGIQQKRDQELVSLLTDDQKKQFAIMDKDYARQFADQMAKRQDAFHQGMDETEKMLNPEQRAKYEQIVQQRLGGLPAGTGAGTQGTVDSVRP